MLNCPLCKCPIIIELDGVPARVLPPISVRGQLRWTLTFDTPKLPWTPEEEQAFLEHRFRRY